MSIKLVQTCSACPEQYDAYVEDEKIGYLRLRHGHFRVEYKDVEIYSAEPRGDGCFEFDEREHYLDKAKCMLLQKHRNPDMKFTAGRVSIEVSCDCPNCNTEVDAWYHEAPGLSDALRSKYWRDIQDVTVTCPECRYEFGINKLEE